MWNIMKNKPVKKSKGWKTVRLFVSSNLKDFRHEREVMEKQVVPDLRLWCELRKLRLVECDLIWGVPNDQASEETIKICLSELDRCYEENIVPFFLDFSGDRAGSNQKFDHLSHNIAAQYEHVYSLSVSKMEIIQTALNKFKPNCLFLIQNIVVVGDVSEEVRKFILCENQHLNEEEEAVTTTIITNTDSNVATYTVQCKVSKDDENNVIYDGLSHSDSQFSNTILTFLQKKIDELYPLDLSPVDPMQVQKEAHRNFLDSRSACVLGRDKIITQIENYIVNGSKPNAPLLVVGVAGAGKSSLMAKCADKATLLAEQDKIIMPTTSFQKCKVFYHFVGATPRSTDLTSFLQRLTKEMKADMLETHTSVHSLISLAHNLFESRTVEPIVIFVDALNQMDEDTQQYLQRWLPESLSPNVRLVISTIEGTESHQIIRSLKTAPTEIICGPLDKRSREAMVRNILLPYNKRLDEDQMNVLLDKVGSRYPLWLTLACEEIRLYGVRKTLINKIKELPDDLICLEETVFERFEVEMGGDSIKACVCMIEVSRHGLLEMELLALLGQDENIKLPENKSEEELVLTEKNPLLSSEGIAVGIAAGFAEGFAEDMVDATQSICNPAQETNEEGGDSDASSLSAKDEVKHVAKSKESWAAIYRKLKPFLRPCGDLGEGRLDFYHRSLSKAVRKKYFSGDEDEKKRKYDFWHSVLADFFEGDVNLDRKAEELPYHLEKLCDNTRLIHCLSDWEVFDRMYKEYFSFDLLHSWQQCGDYDVAVVVYLEQLSILRNSEMPLIEYVETVEKVYGFLIQAGQYEEALQLMEVRLTDELDKLGERPEKMADIYQNMARCKSEVQKAIQMLNTSHINNNVLIVEYGRKCLQYRKQLEEGTANNYRCALMYIITAHHLRNIATITRDEKFRREAYAAIEEATRVFTELGDIGHIAECLMTKAIINYAMPFPEREKLLIQSLKLCLEGYGENHLLTSRIYLNTGIAYGMAGDWRTSFGFFTKLLKICMTIFGPSHPKTKRAITELERPIFVRMAAERERIVPHIA